MVLKANSSPIMKFQSIGFPFEEGPVLASKVPQHSQAHCVYQMLWNTRQSPLLFIQWYQPKNSVPSLTRPRHHLGSQGAPLPLLNLSF